MKVKPGSTILFHGDSITDAFRKPEEVNLAFKMGNGYVFLLVARLAAAYPESGIHYVNKAVSGYRLTEVEKCWQADAVELKPDIISLLAGVNDTLTPDAESEISRFAARYASLLERAREAVPHVRFILAEPFLLPCGNVTKAQLADVAERRETVREMAKRFDAILIPTARIFSEACKHALPEYWAFDGIHPTAAGFWLMAEKWGEVLEIASEG